MMDERGTSATACRRPTAAQIDRSGEVPGPASRDWIVDRPFDGDSTREGRSMLASGGVSGSGRFVGLGRADAQIVPSGRTSSRSLNENVSKLNARNNRAARLWVDLSFLITVGGSNRRRQADQCAIDLQQLTIDRIGDNRCCSFAASPRQRAARSVSHFARRARCHNKGPQQEDRAEDHGNPGVPHRHHRACCRPRHGPMVFVGDGKVPAISLHCPKAATPACKAQHRDR